MGQKNNLANAIEGLEFKNRTGRNHPEDSYNNEATNVAKMYELYNIRSKLNDSGGVEAYREAEIIDGIGTASGADDSVFGYAAGWGPTGVEMRAGEGFRALLKFIQITEEKGKIERIKLDVFGFSRGSTAARHFVNCVRREYWSRNGTLQGEPQLVDVIPPLTLKKIEIRFLGMFDTVVSWGYVANDDNHGNLMVGLPDDAAKKMVHIVALDEFRENFPLTHAPATAETIWMPGAHSDIGGGYRFDWVDEVEILSRGSESGYDPGSQAVAALEPLRSKLIREAWISPSDTDALRVDVEQKSPQSYYVSTFLTRNLATNAMSRASLHVMHKKAMDAGVPLAGMPSGGLYEIEDLKIKTLVEDTLAGRLMKPNCGASYPYRRDYVHYSASWVDTWGFKANKPHPSDAFPDLLPERRTEYPNVVRS